MGQIFSFMSGKGGVGKSTIAAALAEFYARQGMRVTLVDGDIGLRCADLILGLQDQVVYDLGDLAEKRCFMEQALVHPSSLPHLSLLAAPQLLRPSDVKAKEMGKIIARLADRQDLVLLDAPAGIGRGWKNILGARGQSVIVATPDDVSIRDAERLSSLLAERGEMHPALVINRINSRLIRRGEMIPPDRLAAMLDLPLMGAIPDSGEIYRALLRHETALHSNDPRTVKAIETLAVRLRGVDAPLPHYAPSRFWQFLSRGGDIKA